MSKEKKMREIKVEAIKTHRYAGKKYNTGDKYYINNVNHFKILNFTKKIKMVPEKLEIKSEIPVIKEKKPEIKSENLEIKTIKPEIKIKKKIKYFGNENSN